MPQEPIFAILVQSLMKGYDPDEPETRYGMISSS